MSAAPVIWKHIGLHGHSVGTIVCEPARVVWKSALTGRDDEASTTKSIPAATVRAAHWALFGKSGHLRLKIKADSGKNLKHEYRFDGFPLADFDLLKETIKKHYKLDLQQISMSAAGAQYGMTSIQSKNLVFRHCVLDEMNEEGQEFEPREEEEMMSLDLAEVSQCVLPGNNRNEIELQFPESDAMEAGTDQLVAVRFYIPPAPDADKDDKEAATAAEMLQQRIMQSASIRKTTGDVLVSFPLEQGTFLTPRGRYAIELYDYFLRMRGQKYDYKIKYDDINRLFLLPKPDEVHMCFVIALDKPIRQGQQRYQYLVLQATKEMDEVTVNMDEDTLQKEYNGELQPVMRGSLSNLIAKTFKVIAQKKVFIPGKFANANQQACVKCAVRASEGFLFPLEKQFVFIHKPTIIIRFNEIESVDFQRYAGGQGSTRNFDLQVNLKASVAAGQARDYTFSGIDRSDYAGLFNFLTAKKITVKNIEGAGFLEEQAAREPVYNEDEIYGGPDEGGMEEDSEDEDFDEAAAAEEEAEAAEDDSEADMDDDEMGSEIDDGLDSDLDDVRKDSKAKKKKKAKAAEADDDEGQSSPKKKRKKKDPNAPKKAMNAYFLYANSVRSEIAAKNPDAGFGDITKLVSSQYKNLSDGERKVWDSKAQAEKKRYQEEMADYSAPEDSDGEDEAPTKKAKKDPNAPKASRSAYNYFGQEMRGTMKAENADLSFAEINKTLGERWKAVSPEEKERFEKLAAEDKKRHTREMASYTPPKGSPAGKKKKPKKDPNAPKSALTTFLIFSKEMRPQIKAETPDIQFSDMGRKLGELFRALTSEEKEKYEKLAQEDKVRYEKEKKAYLKPLPPDDGVDDDTDGDMEDEDDDDDDDDE